MAEVLAPDARSVYGDGRFTHGGRDLVSMHDAHTPEIEITSEATACGTGHLEDFVPSVLPRGGAPGSRLRTRWHRC